MSHAHYVNLYLAPIGINVLQIDDGSGKRLYELSPHQVADLVGMGAHALASLNGMIEGKKENERMAPPNSINPAPDKFDIEAGPGKVLASLDWPAPGALDELPEEPPIGIDPKFHRGGILWNRLVKGTNGDAFPMQFVQAPANWSPADVDAFNYYRSGREKLLMRQGVHPYRMKPRQVDQVPTGGQSMRSDQGPAANPNLLDLATATSLLAGR
jgi:hypothetical protein